MPRCAICVRGAGLVRGRLVYECCVNVGLAWVCGGRLSGMTRALIALLISCACLAGCHAPSRVPVGKVSPRLPDGVTVVQFPGGDSDVTLEGWWYEPTPDAELAGEALAAFERRRDVVVIYCHGVMESQDGLSTYLLVDAGYRVLTFDYRGFGNSTMKRKTNEGMARDAMAALAYVRSREDVDADRVAVFGHSMGAAYALSMGADAQKAGEPVRAVVAASGFSSWRRAADAVLPVVGLLVAYTDGRDPVDNAAKLGETPLLVAHCPEDDVMPVSNARRIFRAAERAKVHATLLLNSDEVSGHELPYIWDGAFAHAIVAFIDAHTQARD
jgi:dipeptidyl aminopeptidase/acylaminoacyl peptidase